jgi:hypothetical protein
VSNRTRTVLIVAAVVGLVAATPKARRFCRQVAAEAQQVYLNLSLDERMKRSARIRAAEGLTT